MRFWTAAEILRGLDDGFAAGKRPALLFPVNRPVPPACPVVALAKMEASRVGGSLLFPTITDHRLLITPSPQRPFFLGRRSLGEGGFLLTSNFPAFLLFLTRQSLNAARGAAGTFKVTKCDLNF